MKCSTLWVFLFSSLRLEPCMPHPWPNMALLQGTSLTPSKHTLTWLSQTQLRASRVPRHQKSMSLRLASLSSSVLLMLMPLPALFFCSSALHSPSLTADHCCYDQPWQRASSFLLHVRTAGICVYIIPSLSSLGHFHYGACFSVHLCCAATSHCRHRMPCPVISVGSIFLSSPFSCPYLSFLRSTNTHLRIKTLRPRNRLYTTIYIYKGHTESCVSSSWAAAWQPRPSRVRKASKDAFSPEAWTIRAWSKMANTSSYKHRTPTNSDEQ